MQKLKAFEGIWSHGG